MITCPRCGGEKFEHHTISGLLLVGDKILPSFVGLYQATLEPDAKYYTCVECEYVITQASDLNLLTVTVCVLGNSRSKQRQGLVSLNGEQDMPFIPLKMMDLCIGAINKNGYFSHWEDEENKMHSYLWVFTKAAWEKYQAEPEFPLAEGQHKTEVKVLY